MIGWIERDCDQPFSRPVSFLPTDFTHTESWRSLCFTSLVQNIDVDWQVFRLVRVFKSIYFADRIANEVMANAAKRNRCGFPILKRAIAWYDLVLGLNRIPGRVKSHPRTAIWVNASRRSHVAAPKWSRYRCCRQCPFDSDPHPTHACTHATWTKCKPVYARY